MSDRHLIQRAAENFRPVSRHLYHYARGKIRWDPVYPEVARRLAGSQMPVLDLGCGAGVLAAYLREKGIEAPIIGVDVDQGKIEIAKRVVASRYDQLQFHVGSALGKRDFSGNIVALDVLHYFSNEEQMAFLSSFAGMLHQDGVLLLRTTVRDQSLRYRLTQFEEWFIRATGWIRGGENNFATRERIETGLREAGLVWDTLPMWGTTPFNSHLFVARKAGGCFSE